MTRVLSELDMNCNIKQQQIQNRAINTHDQNQDVPPMRVPNTWPIIFGVLPTVCSLFLGDSSAWIDVGSLILMVFWLYQMIKGKHSSFKLI
jgi:hypothetical protein